jgi:hypothetical protein
MSGDEVFPDRGMEHRDKIAWMVEQHGWALEPVPPHPELDPPIPGYAYTVGLETTFAFPEVVLFGLTPVASRGLTGLVVDLLRSGTVIPIGSLFTGLLDNDLRSALLPVDLDEYETLFAVATDWYGGADYRMVQLAWPDRNGWLPWEAGFDHRLLLAQPVIGALDEVEEDES